eukprot:jgi/Chlat1/8059/Chrsp73S07521
MLPRGAWAAATAARRFGGLPRGVRWLSVSAGGGGDVGGELGIEHLSGEDEGIQVWSLRRPSSRNSLGRVLVGELGRAVESAAGDARARAVVLRSGVEGVFCAGADLKERRQMIEDETVKFVNKLRSTFSALEALPVPTIAAMDGHALGGGLELALACDMRIAGASAVLGLPETSLAIIPGAGGTQRLARLIGMARAKEMIFTAARISAQQAEDIGLVNYCVPEGTAFERALQIAKQIAQQGPLAVKMAKLAVNRGCEVDLATGLVIEESCYQRIIPSQDRLEGLAAFVEKRKPKYIGK